MHPHQVLDLPVNATDEQIKAAYREKAKKFHPDKAPEGQRAVYESKMKEVNAAYAALTKGDGKERIYYSDAGAERDPFGFDSGVHVHYRQGFQQYDWKGMHEQAREMFRRAADELRRQQAHHRRTCPTCNGTGYIEDDEEEDGEE